MKQKKRPCVIDFLFVCACLKKGLSNIQQNMGDNFFFNFQFVPLSTWNGILANSPHNDEYCRTW